MYCWYLISKNHSNFYEIGLCCRRCRGSMHFCIHRAACQQNSREANLSWRSSRTSMINFNRPTSYDTMHGCFFFGISKSFCAFKSFVYSHCFVFQTVQIWRCCQVRADGVASQFYQVPIVRSTERCHSRSTFSVGSVYLWMIYVWFLLYMHGVV